MVSNLLRYWLLPCIVLIVALLAGSFLVSGWANTISLTVLTVSLSIATFPVVRRQIRMIRAGPASKMRLARNILIEFVGIVLAMLLAGFIGRFAAEVLTSRVGDQITKLLVGIFIGMLTGLGTGFLFRRTWGRWERVLAAR